MNKKSIIVSILILIAAFVIGWGIYIWFNSFDRQNVSSEKYSETQITEQSSGAICGAGFRQMVKVLDLSPQQIDEFSNIETRYRSKIQDYIQQLDAIDLAILNEIKSDSSDKQRLDSLAVRSGEIQYALKKATYEHFLKIKELCTPNQQEKFNTIINNINRFRQGKGYGRGKGQGRRSRGQRWNNR